MRGITRTSGMANLLVGVLLLGACSTGDAEGLAASTSEDPDEGAASDAGEVIGADEPDPKPDGDDDHDAPSSTGDGGSVTVDGTTYATGRTMLCDPPDDIGGGEGVAEMVEDMETMNLHSTTDVGQFAVYLAEIGFRSLELTWDQGPGEGIYKANFGDPTNDGIWVLMDESFEEPDHSPLDVAGGRATGQATLEAVQGDGHLDVSYDLVIPDEATC